VSTRGLRASLWRNPKKKKKVKKIIGLSEDDIRQRVRSSIAQDGRPYRAQAMDAISLFRERQMQMQDKQGDLKTAMDGPDWPQEDWPLNTADAKAVGEAESMIQAGLAILTSKLDAVGGLGRAHESGDKSIVEQLATLSEMMDSYCQIIDRHVSSVRRVRKKSAPRDKKRAKAKTQKSSETSANSGSYTGSTNTGGVGGASLREQLLNFGGSDARGGQQSPFAWLRSGPPNDGTEGNTHGASSTFGAAGTFGNAYGASTAFGAGGAFASWNVPPRSPPAFPGTPLVGDNAAAAHLGIGPGMGGTSGGIVGNGGAFGAASAAGTGLNGLGTNAYSNSAPRLSEL